MPTPPIPYPSTKLIPWSVVEQRTSLSKPTAWREWRKGRFPKPVKISPQRVAWLESEIDAWIAARSAGQAA